MLTTMLLSTASELGSDDYLSRVTNIAASAREALLDVMTINGNLGAAIALYITELERFCRERDGLATLKSIAEDCDRRVETSEFILDRPVIVAPDGDWTNIRSWRVVRRL